MPHLFIWEIFTVS